MNSTAVASLTRERLRASPNFVLAFSQDGRPYVAQETECDLLADWCVGNALNQILCICYRGVFKLDDDVARLQTRFSGRHRRLIFFGWRYLRDDGATRFRQAEHFRVFIVY